MSAAKDNASDHAFSAALHVAALERWIDEHTPGDARYHVAHVPDLGAKPWVLQDLTHDAPEDWPTYATEAAARTALSDAVTWTDVAALAECRKSLNTCRRMLGLGCISCGHEIPEDDDAEMCQECC